MFRRTQTTLFTLAALVAATVPLYAQTAAATYLFNNNLNAEQRGVPALTATDPQATSGFGTDIVFGHSRPVYNFVGNASPPAEQSGLTLNTTGLVTPDNYSVEMAFKFTDRSGAWRRILDVQNRQSDNGFYVDPSNNLDIYPVSGSSQAYTNNVYHHVVMTDANTGTVKGYLDGTLQFTASTSIMHINNADNPNKLLNFFLDNTVAGGQGEYSGGSIALVRVYDGVLTDDQIMTLNNNFPGTPAPGALTVGLLGAIPGVMLLLRRRRK